MDSLCFEFADDPRDAAFTLRSVRALRRRAARQNEPRERARRQTEQLASISRAHQDW